MPRQVQPVSVIICTYAEERWHDLLNAVFSVLHQDPPPREVIVVVDHNPPLYDRVRSELSEVVTVANGGPSGLSAARNAGIAVASSKLIAFIDDDAAAEPGSLLYLTRLCESPHVLGAGANVEPAWDQPPPPWFPQEFYWVVGCSYRGLPEETSPVRNLFGGAMCLKREVLEMVGGFRNAIGRVGRTPLGGEETELCIRAARCWPDHVFLYEPRAIVCHRVPTDRTRWTYFSRRCYYEGFSKGLMSHLVGVSAGLASERPYVLRTLTRGFVKGLVDPLARRDVTGPARSGAILAGLALTTLGYVIGRTSGASESGERGDLAIDASMSQSVTESGGSTTVAHIGV